MAKQTQRLDKYLSATTDLTRSLAKKALHRGEVRVNDQVVKNPGLQITGSDQVQWQEQLLELQAKRYLMLHKPVGYECTQRSAHHPLASDLIEVANKESLQTVGRLDVATSGLLFLTDDGQWLHKMTSPRQAKAKVYLADLAEPLMAEAEQLLAQGLLLQGEVKPTQPAVLERLTRQQVRITVTEGRYHLVRRIFAALGNHVVHLHREAVAGLWLDSQLLPEGQWRYLSKQEVDALATNQ